MSYPSQGRSRWIDLRLAEEHTREPLTVIVQKTCPLVSTLATDELSITMYKFSRSLAPPLMQQNECLIQKGIRTPFLHSCKYRFELRCGHGIARSLYNPRLGHRQFQTGGCAEMMCLRHLWKAADSSGFVNPSARCLSVVTNTRRMRPWSYSCRT